ncbi:MAG: roadblock/LC7 domain-containing protein [Candidatus Thermoplasmatota archaeon]|nr:roadblock/LC7 domain-containing protein [Candidatus Thermoplasmatota archaeon]
MASPNKAIREVLNELRSLGEISNAAVVSRSGMLIDGDAPDNIHMETFGAMMAIMLGAAETATSEAQETLQHIDLELSQTHLVLMGAGQRILLACFISDKTARDKVIPFIDEAAARLKSMV